MYTDTYGASSYYLPEANIPKIFREADRQEAERHRNDPKPIREPIVVDMPIIEGCPGAKPKVIVTEDWYLKTEKKRRAKMAKESRDLQIEMMQLLARRDQLRDKLGELDPGDKKDSKKIVDLNVRLKDIDAELEALQKESGINLNELDHGSKLGRFIGRLKHGWKRFCKKAKKIYRRNKELVDGILGIAIPVITVVAIKKIICLLGY